jgi:8-oxo-dGTP pyrophosphatase MutT (NUDIX family)
MSDPSRAAAAPRDAATLILLREHEGDVEVLMTRRHADLSFMGGLWVFPGGALTQVDQSDAARALVNTARNTYDLRDITGAKLSEAISLGLGIAACRETFEEAGVLLASRADGAPIAGEQLARLQSEREQMASDPSAFVAALAREALRLDFSRMIYWAHWITPSFAGRRFDTRFFVAKAPDSHELAADTYETTECVWLSPQELLHRAQRGDMGLAQPTRYNLEDLRASLERHGTLEALLQAEAQRDIAAIMPKMHKAQGRTMIVMPWDPEFDAIPGEAVRTPQRYSPVLLALPSRVERDH